MEVERCYSQIVQDLLSLDVASGASRRPMPFLTTFTSYDCETPMMKEELENLFAQNASCWEKTDVVTWTLPEKYNAT